jgi:histone H2A
MGFRKKAKSKSSRAGLQFPVSRIMKRLRGGRYAHRFAQGAPIFLAAVLEYLSAEVLELGGNATRDARRKRIIPRDLQLAVRSDEELAKLLDNCTFPSSGVLPSIHVALIQGQKQNQLKAMKGNTQKSPKSPKSPSSKESSTPTPKKKKSTPSSSNSNNESSLGSESSNAPTSPSDNQLHWQYFDGVWKSYAKEADRVVEEAYQDYLKNPGCYDVRAIKSGQWMYQVDFVNLKQTNIQHESHKVRDIRRV